MRNYQRLRESQNYYILWLIFAPYLLDYNPAEAVTDED